LSGALSSGSEPDALAAHGVVRIVTGWEHCSVLAELSRLRVASQLTTTFFVLVVPAIP
jgi:hypothetical protein